MTKLTPRQLDMARAIYHFRYRHGYGPTLGDLGGILGISKVPVRELLQKMLAKGAITMSRYKARSIVLLIPPAELGITPPSLKFPVVGTISSSGIVLTRSLS